LFPTGNMEFIIPKESRAIVPSPHYHCIEDMKIIFVQWELNYPNIFLPCTTHGCTGELIHERSELSKKEVLSPVYECGKPHVWVISMWYRCCICDKRVAGNSGELLHSLPSHIADAYQVYPRYASANHHISKHATDIMEDLFITYGNVEFFNRMIYQLLNKSYVGKTDSYYQQCVFLGVMTAKKYPTIMEVVGEFYPDAAKFRELYVSSQQSNLTRSGVSEMDRYTREIQSVTCSTSMAQDHTMEVTKNYMRKDGYKACWTVCNERGEIASVVLVGNTKSSQYAHAVESLIRRPNFKPKVMYADTWPHLQEFWKALFGHGCIGRFVPFLTADH
jgi:hypothetical protein